MKVLPEQILAWLKSTFGKDEANQVNINLILLNELTIKINTFFQSELKIIWPNIIKEDDDKKRTFRGVVAAMRVISGFRGKKVSHDQSGKTFFPSY